MSKTQWTAAQSEAITTKYRKNGESCNILVNAAAGSGKTAVLVERIIQKLIPPDISKSIDIDKLLVVTFTNSAAAEMEERIRCALSSELDKASANGDSERRKVIRRQQLLLGSADITTIDAFCLRLIRANFNLLGIDPNFSIADSSQTAILADEAMEELFSQLYDEGDEEFLNLLCLYASSRSDDGLASLVQYIHRFTRSIPTPFDRLDEMAEDLLCADGIQNTAWFKKGFVLCRRNISDLQKLVNQGLSIMLGHDFSEQFLHDNPPEKSVPAFDEWRSYYRAFYAYYFMFKDCSEADFDTLSRLISSFSYPALSALKSKDDEIKDRLKAIIASIKAIYPQIKDFVCNPLADIQAQSREKLYPVARALINLVKKFDNLYYEKKSRKNILEFYDIEQLALALLTEHEEVSKELQDKYTEILMDEYQDTNALQEEIFKHISDGRNMFMVGDMKQSIYRFRSSDPIIFKRKNDLYKNEPDSENRKIILSQNFRSRNEVLQGINDVFSAIMSEQAGELDYDDEQRLYLGNTTYQNQNQSYSCECCIIQGAPTDSLQDENEEPSQRTELEARFIAAKINELKRLHYKVRDKDGYRDIENRDIVILMSSHKAAADIYTAEFSEAGIECFVESKGYFEKNEIRLMISLLKIISNPYNDIPLLGVLRSPIASFTDDELVTIRRCKRGKFYGALKELVSLYEQSEIVAEDEIKTAEKAKKFCENLSRWRNYSRFMSSDRFIWTLYEETDFYAFAGAMCDGEESQANLRLLFERAKQYESNGFQGLFNFVKYLENLEKRKDSDLSSAQLIGEGYNVVRIMTIHKSKGLEFPVVFIAGGGKTFNNQTDDSRIILHKDLGFGMDYIDFENSYRVETLHKRIVKSAMNAEFVSEEIRKLYVAMTRAKEKLFFVATVSGEKSASEKITGLKKRIEKWKSVTTDGRADFSVLDVLSAKGFVDWIAPVAMTSENWNFSTINFDELSPSAADTDKTEKTSKIEINIEHLLEFAYPYRDIVNLPTKASVSDFKQLQSINANPLPAFLSENRNATGISYGNALHIIMENFRPKSEVSEKDVCIAVSDMVQHGLLSADDASRIAPEKIAAFYRSDLGKRVLASPHVYREQAFEVNVPASLLYPVASKKETILVQGVIDCWFEEEGEIVLIDYKTDRYSDTSEIHEKYDAQLKLYSYALKKIRQKPIKNAYFYLFFDNNVI
ncbi:MAG: helicase-exonuclease AddAB subunit AddA [Firmicutes bacterium]|nr:helicase-exonuclease AddAB subunit AddA [Bacillota bacterium]